MNDIYMHVTSIYTIVVYILIILLSYVSVIYKTPKIKTWIHIVYTIKSTLGACIVIVTSWYCIVIMILVQHEHVLAQENKWTNLTN